MQMHGLKKALPELTCLHTPHGADVSRAARELQSSGDAASAQAQQMLDKFASTYEDSMKAQQVRYPFNHASSC